MHQLRVQYSQEIEIGRNCLHGLTVISIEEFRAFLSAPELDGVSNRT
jgi:hypothetical protein